VSGVAGRACAASADVVVVGAGVAGAAAALTAAARGLSVVVLVKGVLGDGATPWAQGGLAVVLDPADSIAAHVQDTLTAGAGLCDAAAVRQLVTAAPAAVAELRALGARFDGLDGGAAGPDQPLALTREGGHSSDRIIHAGGDASGAEVSRSLLASLRRSPVRVEERVLALDVLLDAAGAVAGLLVADLADDGRLLGLRDIRAPEVVLATGGLGQAYATTTNPASATGSGLCLALRAGAHVADVEFVQFHPTVLWQGPNARGQQVLVSEAVRGEGAVLVDATGAPVMSGAHPLADLAPRDVVAATMHARMAESPGGVSTHLWLDATRLGRDFLERRFPTILAACRAGGVDPVDEPIPVAPGAHYSCGGVVADLDGSTGVVGLSAVGEVAATGVHGANRLASNSLTEGLVAGRRTGARLASSPRRLPAGPATASAGWTSADPADRAATALATSRGAGVLRTAAGLAELLETLESLAGPRVDPVSATAAVTAADVEAADLHLVSTLVATAALERNESRGCHRRADTPAQDSGWLRRVTLAQVDGRLRVVVGRAGGVGAVGDGTLEEVA